jgi:kynurenine formamidase
MNLEEAIFAAHAYTTVGQYGTHVDAPAHMVKGGRTLDEVTIEESVMPLCVINKEDAVAENADYVLTVEDILEWEAVYGKIPEKLLSYFRAAGADVLVKPWTI